MIHFTSFVTAHLAGIVIIVATASTVGAGTFSIATGTNTSLGTAQSINLSPNLVLLQQAPNYTLATAQSVSPQYRAYDVLGSINAGISQEFFSFPLSDGNQLTSFVSAGNPATQFPELLLYDPNGNLVAVAAGNGADGSSSQIDFTVPGGDTGNWTVEVTGSPNMPPGNNFFNYDLLISGDTGVGPIDPLNVPGTAVVPEPSTFSIMATGALVCLAFIFIRWRKIERPIDSQN